MQTYQYYLLNQFANPELRLDRGELTENYVFLRLRDSFPVDQVKYWRTADGNEVDFVVNTEFGKGFAIESKFDEKAFSLSRYKKFTETYPEYPLSVKSYETINLSSSLLGF